MTVSRVRIFLLIIAVASIGIGVCVGFALAGIGLPTYPQPSWVHQLQSDEQSALGREYQHYRGKLWKSWRDPVVYGNSLAAEARVKMRIPDMGPFTVVALEHLAPDESRHVIVDALAVHKDVSGFMIVAILDNGRVLEYTLTGPADEPGPRMMQFIHVKQLGDSELKGMEAQDDGVIRVQTDIPLDHTHAIGIPVLSSRSAAIAIIDSNGVPGNFVYIKPAKDYLPDSEENSEEPSQGGM